MNTDPPCPNCDEAQRLLVQAEATALERLRALRAANSRWKNARRDFIAVRGEKNTALEQLAHARAVVARYWDGWKPALDQGTGEWFWESPVRNGEAMSEPEAAVIRAARRTISDSKTYPLDDVIEELGLTQEEIDAALS